MHLFTGILQRTRILPAPERRIFAKNFFPEQLRASILPRLTVRGCRIAVGVWHSVQIS